MCYKRLVILLGIIFGISVVPVRADSFPALVTPWVYYAIGCGNFWGPMDDEGTIAAEFAKVTYGSTATLKSNTGWGTIEDMHPGPCGSTNAYPEFDKRGVEVKNYNDYTVEYTTGDGPNNVSRDGISVRRTRTSSCPPNTDATGFGTCSVRYNVAPLPDEPSPPEQCAGNPIEIKTGYKFQREVDVPAARPGGVSFERYYHKTLTAGWKNNYDKKLQIIEPLAVALSPVSTGNYGSKAQACTSGWTEIRDGVSKAWAAGSSAQFTNGICQVVKDNVVVSALALIPTYAQAIYYVAGTVNLHRPNGTTITFAYDGVNYSVSMSGNKGALRALLAGGWRYTSTDGAMENYNRFGQLVSQISAEGVEQHLQYDDSTGQLTDVTDSFGRKLTLTYIGNKISEIIFDTNKKIQYQYTDTGLDLAVHKPNNLLRAYHYEDLRFPDALTGITDEKGIRYVTWGYDDVGRAILSEHADGADKTLFKYNGDDTVIVTNSLGKNTTYKYELIAGAKRIAEVEGEPTESCVGANQYYTYTEQGWLLSKTDWKGVKTHFSYNVHGQEVSRIEAYETPMARETKTEWDPIFNLKTKVTEGNRETVYKYDGNGKLIQKTVRSLN